MVESQVKFAAAHFPTIESDFNTAFTQINNFRYRIIESIFIGDLQLQDIATITVKDIPGEFQFSFFAFASFCKILGIPESLIHRVPFDLLEYNVRNLLADRSASEISLITREVDGKWVVINVLAGEITEVNTSDFLSFFDNSVTIEHVSISEIRSYYYHTFAEQSFSCFLNESPEERKQLSFFLGSVICHHPLGGKKLVNYTTLVDCTTGNIFIFPFFGKQQAKYSLRPEERMLRFTEVLQNHSELRVATFCENASTSLLQNLSHIDYQSLWYKLKNLVGDVVANDLLDVTEEQRLQIFKELSTINVTDLKIQNALAEFNKQTEIEGVTVLKVASAISEYARVETSHDLRFALEMLAGKFLEKHVVNP